MQRLALLAITSCGALLGQVGDVTTNVTSDTTASARPSLPSGRRPPLTAAGRFRWMLKASLGPDTLFADALYAGIGTKDNKPEEFGPHWGGFGSRFGSRVLYGATSATFEASAGSLWGEDPRYVRATGQPVASRVKNVVISAFLAHNGQGEFMPAYARYMAYTGTSFLSNQYRPSSETSLGDTLGRIPLSFAGRMAKNAFSEFFPDLKKRVFGKKDSE